MVLFQFETTRLVKPPQELTAFVQQLIKRLGEEGFSYQGHERRCEERHLVALQVHVMPLDESLQPLGPAFTAMTHDISNSGIGLVHSAKIESPLLAVAVEDPDGESFQAAVEVLRCRPVGPYFEIGGKFVTKIITYDPFRPGP